MTERDIIKAALAAAGVEPTRPRSVTYLNPRYAAPEEPVEAEQVEQAPAPTPGVSTSTRPVPLNHTPATPTGGFEPNALPTPDPRTEARELAEQVLARERGFAAPTPTVHATEGRDVWPHLQQRY